MFTESTKKQNRILLVALVVLLIAMTVLIALTGSANKKTNEEKDPPIVSNDQAGDGGNKPIEKNELQNKDDKDTIGNKVDDNGKNTDDTEQNKPDDKSDTSKPEDDKKTSTDNGDDVEVSANPSTTALPTFTLPIKDGIVLKGFSGVVPVFSYTMNDYRTHNGIDFACSAKTPVYAAADGKICEINDDPMMGVTIGVEHSGGAVTRYKGLSEESLTMNKLGDTVKAGQVIGSSGDTALIESAEEDHVHFELTINGESKDPAEYMNVTYLSEITED
ncbi:MAG: M23 family metallopeptidase [Ruminococcaceae bacterium]|nr:M23 family metallopeptidase [Oscillospiraceae bacterium]